MKARFKIGDTISNGKIQYTVLGFETNQLGELCYIFKNPITDNNFKWVTQEVDRMFELIQNTPDSFDWQSFRAEAAKDILCAMIGEVIKQRNGSDLIDNTVRSAIVITDNLISKLKEKEEK